LIAVIEPQTGSGKETQIMMTEELTQKMAALTARMDDMRDYL
jgi:hypothetical protein